MFRRILVRVARLNVAPILPTTRAAPLARHLRTSPPRLAIPPPSDPVPPDATVSQRLKHLVRSYGWYALGVYLVFSALDFSVAFVGINLLGADKVSQAATYVKHLVAGFVRTTPREPGSDEIEPSPADGAGHEGLYAMLVLAYTIHKTVFLPVRVGLTAALTPRIVGWLRARGWANGAKRAAREMRDRD